MRMEKKRHLKEDGRYLIYYHFPESASPEQAGTFASLPASVQAGAEGAENASLPPGAAVGSVEAAPSRQNEGERRV
ncbi:MAG TPA: hypothetical protein VFB38_24980 [Chthonomonadaceae bacterium]|nr:hypothetical protein [Chthonomonadaceae bacterium]